MKNILLATALAATLPFTALAQTAAKPAAPAAKPAAAAPKVNPGASRTELNTKAKNMAAGIEAADKALSPEELAIAERVYTGKLPCELGNTVTITPDPKAPGFFSVTVKTFKYRMFPVVTTTGAIRLEDQKAGAVWMQLANKSMLLNQKLGQRLADECVSPAQVAVGDALKKAPAQSVLDAPVAAASAPAAAPAAPAASAAK